MNNTKEIEKENSHNSDLNQKIENLETKKDSLREENDKAMTNYIKIKDEPTRIGKGNENLKIAVNHVKNELDNDKREETNYENHIVQEQNAKEKNQKVF